MSKHPPATDATPEALVRSLLRGVQKDQVRIMIEGPKDGLNPVKVAQGFHTQVPMLRQEFEEPPNFLFYQKEQIPSFGKGFSSVGSF